MSTVEWRRSGISTSEDVERRGGWLPVDAALGGRLRGESGEGDDIRFDAKTSGDMINDWYRAS
jgi:hypothetical protein